MRQDSKSSDGWRTCRGGEIGGLVKELRMRRVREVLRTGAVLGAFLAFSATTALGFQVLTFERVRGGMTCSEAQPILSRFADGLLTPSLAGRVASHLIFCPNCQFDYNKMRNWNLPPLTAPDESAASAHPAWTASEVVDRMLEEQKTDQDDKDEQEKEKDQDQDRPVNR